MKIDVESIPSKPTTKVVAIIEFRPWPFVKDNVTVDPSVVGTITADASVSWASHRTFVLLSDGCWDRLIIFNDQSCAVAHRDHRFITVGTELVVK